MPDFAVRDIHPQHTMVVCPLIEQDPLDRACVTPFHEDDPAVHPHEPWEAKRLYRTGPVRDVHEA